MDRLRETARDRWQRNHEQQARLAEWRRLAVLFFLSLAVTMCILLSVKITAQHIAGPTAEQIERGLDHE